MSDAYRPSGFCPTCGYRTDAGVCSECGEHVDKPAKLDPRTLRKRTLRKLTFIASLALGVAAAAVIVGLAVYTWMPSESLRRIEERGGFVGRAAEWYLDQRHRADEAKGKDQERRIREELASLDHHEWAGIYQNFGSYGYHTLAAAPQSGFVELSWHNMRSTLTSCGAVESVTPSEIRLAPRCEYFSLRGSQREWEFIRVRWGDRVYLTPRETLRYLTRAARQHLSRSDYYHGWVRIEDEAIEYPDNLLPRIPKHLCEYLAAAPNYACIVSVGLDSKSTSPTDEKVRRVTVVVDKGADDGIAPDTILQGMFHDFPVAHVIHLQSDAATVSYTTTGETDDSAIMPKLGWQFAILPSDVIIEAE